MFIYNVADHRQAYEEVGSQGISYTAGVPPVAAAMLIASGEWDVRQMANVEELPPRPFLDILNRIGLPTRIKDEQAIGRSVSPDERDEEKYVWFSARIPL